MFYLKLIGLILIFWIAEMMIARWFRNYVTRNDDPMNLLVDMTGKSYIQVLVDSCTNITTYGFLGIIGILLGSWITKYVPLFVMVAFGTITAIGLLRTLLMFFTTVPLSFKSDHKGIEGTGKGSDWIFFLGSLWEDAFMVTFALITYNKFF